MGLRSFPKLEFPSLDDILNADHRLASWESIGASREGRPVQAARIGHGRLPISAIAGCHADEPVGPVLLRQLVAFLQPLPPEHPLLRRYTWWIVPHANPDGEARNQCWYDSTGTPRGVADYLRLAVRELPGDDMEFGFPSALAEKIRPENQAIADWLRQSEHAFLVHASLHGMGFSAGPWFLLAASWIERSACFQRRCQAEVAKAGYMPHDVERQGEKGFRRIAPGFCTHPTAAAMRAYFVEREQTDVAARFRPSSMEFVQSLGGDPFTVVSEMPLFILPDVGRELGPPDPAWQHWQERIGHWRAGLMGGRLTDALVTKEADSLGIKAMPVFDQQRCQWEMIVAALQTAEGELKHTPAES